MTQRDEIDQAYMKTALEEARLGGLQDEVPVGAVIVVDDRIVARAHNAPISLNDPSAHAEMLAIRQAAALFGNYRLSGTTLYVTLEPCLMCAGAMIHARIGRLVFGTRDPKGGAVVSVARVFSDCRPNHFVESLGGVLAGRCAEILSSFFMQKRL